MTQKIVTPTKFDNFSQHFRCFWAIFDFPKFTPPPISVAFNVGDWLVGWLAGRVIILPLCGLSCRKRLSRFSAELKFQDRPSVAKTSWGWAEPCSVQFWVLAAGLTENKTKGLTSQLELGLTLTTSKKGWFIITVIPPPPPSCFIFPIDIYSNCKFFVN